MSIIVQKFGGTSVATAQKILAAAERAVRAKRSGKQVVVVVSARGDKTDELIELAREITSDSLEDFASFMKKQNVFWAKIIKDVGIKTQ